MRSAIHRRGSSRARAILLSVVVLLVAWSSGRHAPYPGWDTSYYLASVSSVLEDGDLDLRNDLLHLDLPALQLLRLDSATLPDGTLDNTFPVGPALYWLPAYLGGLPARWLGAGGARWNAVQLLLLLALALAATVFVVWFFDRWLRRMGLSPRSSAALAVALLLSSPLLVYAVRDYTMSHLWTVVASCLVVASVLRFERLGDWRSAFLVGAALGFSFVTRWQGLVLGLLAVPALWSLRTSWRRAIAVGFAMAGGALPFLLFQSTAWAGERGAWIAMPQGSGYMHWAHPELWRFAFSGYNGLFVWSPLFLFALIGLTGPWRLRLPRSWRWTSLAVLLIDIYVNACVDDWWGGASFGARRMTVDVPLVALGIANLSRLTGRRLATWLLVALSLWGLWAANLSRRGVADIKLAILGTSSDAPGTERESGVVRDANRARDIALSFPLKAGQFNEAGSSVAARTMGLVTAGCATLLAGLLLARRRVASRWPRVVGGLWLASLALCARLALGPHADRAERAEWERLVGSTGSQESARESGKHPSPTPERLRDAYAFLGAMRGFSLGRSDEATAAMRRLAEAGYPAARRFENEELEGGQRALVLLEGDAFLQPQRRAAGRVFLFHSPAAKAIAIEFTLLVPQLEEDACYSLLRVESESQPVGALSLFTSGEARLVGPLGTRDGHVDWSAGARYGIRLEFDLERGKVSAVVTPANSRPLRMEIEGRTALAPSTWQIVFGRARSSTGDDTMPLLGGSFEDLRVTLTKREPAATPTEAAGGAQTPLSIDLNTR